MIKIERTKYKFVYKVTTDNSEIREYIVNELGFVTDIEGNCYTIESKDDLIRLLLFVVKDIIL